MSKTCTYCGKTIDDSLIKCPYCGSENISSTPVKTNAAPVTYNQNISDKIEHLLFYWVQNNHYIFSRSKFLTVLVFLVCFVSFGLYEGILFGIVMSLIFTIPTAIVGFIIHHINKNTEHPYNDSLRDNINHFLLYWWNGREFVVAKTKLITLGVFIGFLLLGFFVEVEVARLAFGSLMGVIFAIPVFIVGYIIHKFTFKIQPQKTVTYTNTMPKPEKLKVETKQKIETNPATNKSIPEFAKYKIKLNELKSDYESIESKTKELIEIQFKPPQLTYDHFMSVVNSCNKLFNAQHNSASTIIDLSTEYNGRIESELNSKIKILESIIDKLEDLSTELVLNISKSNSSDVDGVLEDMENLIDSINEY